MLLFPIGCKLLSKIERRQMGREKCKRFNPNQNKMYHTLQHFPHVQLFVSATFSLCQKALRFPHPIPGRLWQIVAYDLFQTDKDHCLNNTENFEELWKIIKLQDTRNITITDKMKQGFARYEILGKRVWDDLNMPEKSS